MSILHEQLLSIMEKNDVSLFGIHPFISGEIPLRKCGATDKMHRFFTSKDAKGYSPKSIITLLIPYDFPHLQKNNMPNICRYARIPDYHHTVGEIAGDIIDDLKKVLPKNKFISFVDNSPFFEVELASRSGLGVIGDNGLLICKQFGSYVFIATIVCDCDFSGHYTVSDVTRCMRCGQCGKACPAHCFDGEGGSGNNCFDADKCLSAITQKKGDVSTFSKEEISLIRQHNTAWGCDICAEVCPMNGGKPNKPHRKLLKNKEDYVDLLTTGILDDFSMREIPTLRAWDWRGDAVIRRNLKIITKKENESCQ